MRYIALGASLAVAMFVLSACGWHSLYGFPAHAQVATDNGLVVNAYCPDGSCPITIEQHVSAVGHRHIRYRVTHADAGVVHQREDLWYYRD